MLFIPRSKGTCKIFFFFFFFFFSCLLCETRKILAYLFVVYFCGYVFICFIHRNYLLSPNRQRYFVGFFEKV
jgi:hypothetical protein